MAICALVATSEFNGKHFQAACEAGCFQSVVAVDGGYGHLRQLGIVPDIALGDFDSLGYVPDDCPVQSYPSHKDASDMEIALQYASDQGFDSAVIYGALGGRLDHTLANMQLFARWAEDGFGIRAVGLEEEIFFLVGPAVYDLPPIERGTVSVFSLTPESRGVCEEGLEYPLDQAVLTYRTSLGLSNELVGAAARISVQEGTLAIFHPLAPGL